MDGIRVRNTTVDKIICVDDVATLGEEGAERASATVQNIQFVSERRQASNENLCATHRTWTRGATSYGGGLAITQDALRVPKTMVYEKVFNQGRGGRSYYLAR